MQLVWQQQDSLCTVWSGGPAPTHAHCGLVSFLPTELRIYMDEGFMARSSLSELGQAHGSRGASSWLCVRGGRSVEQCTHAAFSRKGSLQLRRVHLAALSERKKKIAEAAMGCAPRSPFWLPLGKQWQQRRSVAIFSGRSPAWLLPRARPCWHPGTASAGRAPAGSRPAPGPAEGLSRSPQARGQEGGTQLCL